MGRYAGDADQRQLPRFRCAGKPLTPPTYSVTGESHYAEMVRDSRRKRRQFDGSSTDWIVVRKPAVDVGIAPTSSSSPTASTTCHSGLASARSTDLPNVWFTREFFFFRAGLTALDDLDEATLGTPPEHGPRHGAGGSHEPVCAS